MLLDLVALAILTCTAALGAWRGTLASASGLLSLVAGYGAAIAFSGRFAPIVAAHVGVSEPIGMAIAGTAFFFVSWLCVSTAFRMWRRIAEMKRAGEARSAADRVGGAAFGFARGAILVVLIGWASLWLEAAQGLAADADLADAGAGRSRAAAVSGAVVERALEAAFSDSGRSGEVMARLAGRPDQALISVRTLIENERFQAIQDDALFWTYVQNDSIESALNRHSFWNLIHDDELRGEFADLGLISEEAAADPQVFRRQAADVLADLGPHLKGLKEDPEIRKLARDPEIVSLVESGNTIALLTHPDVRRVVSRVSSRVKQERAQL